MYFGGHQSSCLLNCFMSKKCPKMRKVKLENFKSDSQPKVMEKVKKTHGICRAHKSTNHDLIRWTNRQEYLNDNS